MVRLGLFKLICTVTKKSFWILKNWVGQNRDGQTGLYLAVFLSGQLQFLLLPSLFL